MISDQILDETKILACRYLPQMHSLDAHILETIKTHLSRRGMTMHQGMIVDATLIAALSSTKNKEAKRDWDAPVLEEAPVLFRDVAAPCFRKAVTPLISTPGGLRT